MFNRMASGLLAAIYSKRMVPMIRYHATSEPCFELARKLNVMPFFLVEGVLESPYIYIG